MAAAAAANASSFGRAGKADKDEDVREVTADRMFEDCEENRDEGNDPDEELVELVRSKSNIERIENASQLYHEKATELIRRLKLAQDPTVLEKDSLITVAQVQQKRFYGCLSLPFSLAMFGFFALSTNLHEDITNVYMIESGLRKVLGHNLHLVDDIPGMWQWMRYDTLVPELFDQGPWPGQKAAVAANKTFWSRVLVYNQLQGPLVLEQYRSEKKPCADALVGDLLCYPQISAASANYGRKVAVPLATPKANEYSGGNVTLQQRQAYYEKSFAVGENERRLRSMRTEYMNVMPQGVGDSFRVFIYPNTPRQSIDEHFKYLYEKGWLDMHTKQVTVKALLLNAEVGRPRLEQYQVIFSFSRGGGIFTRLTLDSLFLEFAAGNFSLGVDFCWFVCLVFMTLLESRILFGRLCQKSGKRGCLKACSKFWTILQWAIIVVGWICVLCYLYQHVLRLDVVEKLKAVIANQKSDTPAEVNNVGEDLFQATDIAVGFTGWFRIMLADYHLILMFRFFMAFHAQPRLGVVTSTLEASVVDIVHFLVVLLPTFMAYAISGCFIFGRRMESFATFDGAIGTCFKMAMEGEYDWPELSTEHYWTAALWTWTFMLLMVLLMMNMVLAIVLDVYTENRKNVVQSETVYRTVMNLLARLFYWRRWVSNQKLITTLPHMNATLTREDLLKEFPSMCERQLNALIHASKYENSDGNASDNQNTMRMTLASKLAIDEIHEEIDQLYEAFDAVTFPPTNHVPTMDRVEPVKGWLHHITKQMAAQNHFMLTAQWQMQQLQWKWQGIEAVHGSDVKFNNLPEAIPPEPEEPL